MLLSETFWTSCKNFLKGYNMWNPAPEIQQKLETKGYRFQPPLSTPFGKADFGTITNREGVNLTQYFANRQAVRQYKQDYKQAVNRGKNLKNLEDPYAKRLRTELTKGVIRPVEL